MTFEEWYFNLGPDEGPDTTGCKDMLEFTEAFMKWAYDSGYNAAEDEAAKMAAGIDL